MTGWLGFEQRWRDQLFAATIPQVEPDGLPGLDEHDTTEFWTEVTRAAPPSLRRGLRVAVWVLWLSPPVLVRRATTFGRLAPGERDRCLRRALEHRAHLVRQLTLLLKVAACLAYFRHPQVRAAVERRAS